jgi:hypothetical protein
MCRVLQQRGEGMLEIRGLILTVRAQPHIFKCPHPLLDVDYKMRVINIPLGYVKKSMRLAVTNKTCMLFMGKPLLSGHYAMGIKGWTGNGGSNLGSQGIVCKPLILV